MTEDVTDDVIYDDREQMQIDAAFANIDWDGMMCFTQLQDIRGYLVNGSCVMLSPNDGFALMNTLEHALSSMTTERNLRARIERLHADVERIGRERDDMARAAQELQARLSAYERNRGDLPTPRVPPPDYLYPSRADEDDLK